MRLDNGELSVDLPADLEWVDEFLWTKVKEKVEVALDGALIIQTATQLKGRPITLRGGSNVWLTREELSKLQAMMDAGKTMTLTLADGRQFQVRFRYAEGAIDYRAVFPNLDRFCEVIIRLMEV